MIDNYLKNLIVLGDYYKLLYEFDILLKYKYINIQILLILISYPNLIKIYSNKYKIILR